MIVHEDRELEIAALDGGLCLCVPVSVYLPNGSDKVVITSYTDTWGICEEYEKRFGENPFSQEGLSFLEEKVAPVIEKYGYSCDSVEHRVIYEYTVGTVTEEMKKHDGAVIIRSPEEIPKLPCLCLQKPEADADDEFGVCAVVIADGAVCSVAGVNDMFTDDTVEIFVETAKKYRRRGFGTAAVAALSMYLTECGHTVGYKCGADNIASAGIAERLGMTLSGKRFDMVCYAEE